MSTKSNLKASMSNQKSRVFLFFMIAVIFIILVIAYSTRNRTALDNGADSGVPEATTITNPGAVIDSIPGTHTSSAEYQELQKKKYNESTNKALNQAGQPVAVLPSLSNTGNAIPGLEPPNYNKQFQSSLEDQKRIQAELLAKQQDQVKQQQIDAANRQTQALMARQLAMLAKAWQVDVQQYVQGKPLAVATNNTAKNYLLDKPATATTEDNKPKIYYKAGDILFGVMLTSVNSDNPGPILARIVSGPLNDAKIIGTINPASIPVSANAPRVSTSLILEFNLINIPGKRVSVPITAVAIDPKTANTGLATSVNRHNLLRYGTFFAANFLSGLGQAISMQNQAKVITNNGTVDVGRSGGFSSTDQTRIAVGKTADALTKSLNFMDTPPTIKIASGTAIGILLQNDLVIQGDNTQQLVEKAMITNNSAVSAPAIPTVVPNQGAANNGSGAGMILPQ